MPLYLYRHPKTKKVIEVVQKMADKHEYVDEKGVKYDRVWLRPRMAVDCKVDPFSKDDFVRRTAKRGMTVGDMEQESAALSEARERKAGYDPVKKKLFNDYKEKTGKTHPADKPKKIETDQFVLEF